MMGVTIQPFVGETERTIRRSRPAFRIAGSARRVKGAKRDRRHAQRSEHGEDPPFDAPEHPATIASGRAESDQFPLPLPTTSNDLYSVRDADAGSPSKSVS